MSESAFPVSDDRWRSGEDVRAHVAEGPEENEVEGHVARPGQERLARGAERVEQLSADDGEDDVEAHVSQV